ncbi:MAG: hypothetical protein R2932_55130 [Caldilineaceae bacterium]
MQREELSAIVETINESQGWCLTSADRAALVTALMPLVAQEAQPTPAAVRQIAINYFYDGPMVAAMQSNDGTGEALWVEWRTYMVSLANSKGLYGDLADELAQEAYIQTVRALGNFRFGSRLKTYFCGIFLNCYRHWARSNRGRTAREATLPVGETDESGEEQLPWLIDESLPGGSSGCAGAWRTDRHLGQRRNQQNYQEPGSPNLALVLCRTALC